MLGHHKSPEWLQRALDKILQVSGSLFELNINICQFLLAGGWQLTAKSVSNCKHFVTLLQTSWGGTAHNTHFATMFQS